MKYDVFIEQDDGRLVLVDTIKAASARAAIEHHCNAYEISDKYLTAHPAFAVSDTHSVDPKATNGLGGIRPSQGHAVKCSVELAALYDAKPTLVFAVVNHPEVGRIAVSKREFRALGLPEVVGFGWLSE